MADLILYFTIDSILLALFILLLIIGFIKKNGKLIVVAYIFFFLFICSVVFTVYQAFKISYSTASEFVNQLTSPRTGEEIYSALFDIPINDCVSVLNHKDAYAPKIDNDIWLNISTCSEEMQRILAQKPYMAQRVSTNELMNTVDNHLIWLDYTQLGDSILVYEYTSNDGRNVQTIWCNLNFSRAIVKDIVD